jgi:hypothetical protein
MTQLFTDNIDTYLSTSASASDTQIVVEDSSKMASPSGGDFQELTLITTDNATVETVKVISRSGNILTLESALTNSFPSGSFVRGAFTAQTADRFRTQIKGLKTITADYTLTSADAGYFFVVDNSVETFITLPANSSVALEVPTFVYAYQKGTGAATFGPAAGVTLNSSAQSSTASQHSVIAVVKVGTDEWVCLGERAV